MAAPALTRRLKDRLVAVHERIRSGGFPNAVTLARELEVTPRTIKRDIELLRVHHGLDVAYDAVRHGYHLADPSQGFPDGPFSEAEVIALFVARQALAAYRGTAIEHILRSGFDRLERRLDGDQRYTLGDLSGLLSFRTPAPEELGVETFRVLSAALRGRREVRFDYHGLADAAPRRRRVRGLHLGCVDHKWYLFGWDTARRALRTFALSRMTRVEATGKTYPKPRAFDLDALLRGAFGVHAGEAGKEYVVRIRFTGLAARLVRERRWHPTQVLEDVPAPRARGGKAAPDVLLTLRLSGLEEVRRWVLGWGADAEVLAPASLRKAIAQTARALDRAHAGARHPRQADDTPSQGPRNRTDLANSRNPPIAMPT